MKTLILLFGAGITLITATSCEKDQSLFATTETRLLGEWRVDKVIYCPTFSINQFNITDQYNDLVFSFNEGNNLVRTNTTSGETSDGTYAIDNEIIYTGDETYQNAEYLSSALINNNNQDVTLLFWRDLNVSRKKITANEQRDGGTFRYTLVRN